MHPLVDLANSDLAHPLRGLPLDREVPTLATCAAWDAPIETGRVSEAALDEVSDLVPSRANPGVLWALEDSGNDPVLWAIDETGALLGTLTVTDASNVDWEDMTIAACSDDPKADCLWVGDVGDNALSRGDVGIYEVREPTVTGPFALDTTSIRYPFRYPSGRNNVEGVAIGTDGMPLLVTKRVDATAELYRFPTLDASTTVTVEKIADIDTGDPSDEHAAEATSAELLTDGSALLVRTYGHLWSYPMTAGVPGPGVELPSPGEQQGESAAWDEARGGVWLTSEGGGQPIWYVGCRL